MNVRLGDAASWRASGPTAHGANTWLPRLSSTDQEARASQTRPEERPQRQMVDL